jgi:hypothetical protein
VVEAELVPAAAVEQVQEEAVEQVPAAEAALPPADVVNTKS